MKKLLNLKLLLFWNIILTVLVILLFINFSRVADRQSDLNSGLNVLLLDIDNIQTVMAEFIDDMEAADSTIANLKKDIREINEIESDINSLGYDLSDQKLAIDELQSEVDKYADSRGDLEDMKFDLEIEIDHLKSDIWDLDMALDDLKFDVDILRDDVQYLLE